MMQMMPSCVRISVSRRRSLGQRFCKRSVMLHPQVTAENTKVHGVFAHHLLHSLRQTVQAIQMQVGEEENRVIVKGWGQVWEMKSDPGGFELQGIALTPLVDAQQAKNRFHENMVIEGVFEVHKVAQGRRRDLAGSEFLEAHSRPQQAWVVLGRHRRGGLG